MNIRSISFTLIVGPAFVLFGLIMASLAPVKANAEFYSYEDRDGTIIFVDDMSRIPPEYRQKKKVRKDEYDNLSEDERKRQREKEQEDRAAIRKRENAQQKQTQQQLEAEEKQSAAARLKEALTTHVTIAGRQVFVPVRLVNGSAEADVMLLLDTGASTSVITPEVAERLNIQNSVNVKIGVVGGRVLNARKIVLSSMEVGPVIKNDQEAVIVRQNSGNGDGLLGMSFLAGLKYTIDFEKQTINWISPQNSTGEDEGRP